MGSLKVVILRWSTRRVLMSRWNRVCWSETLSLWRGGIPGSEYHSLWRRGLPWGESHLYWRGGNPLRRLSFALDRGNPLRRIPLSGRRRLPWSESHSLWRGEAPWGESHSLGEGNPLERGGTPRRRIPFALEETPLKRIPFAVERGSLLRWISFTWRKRRGPPEANPIRCIEGGEPLGRIPSTWRRGPPGQGGGLYEANSIRIGEVHSLLRGGTPWRRFPPERRRFALLEKRLQKQDRWRRLLDDDDLEGWRIWTWMTESIRWGRNPWRSDDWRTPTPKRLRKS